MESAAVVICFTLFLAAIATWPEQLIKTLLALSWLLFLIASLVGIGNSIWNWWPQFR